MKKIFPIITLLIVFSLLGIIFFQILWINGSLSSEEKKFKDKMFLAVNDAAESLINEKGNLLPLFKKNESIFGNDKLQIELFRPTISQKFTKPEIRLLIQNAFEKHGLSKVPFEFSVGPNTLIDLRIQSDHYDQLAADSVNSHYAIALESPSGSLSEGISPEEYLVIIVPHEKRFIWHSLIWLIIGSLFFTIIIISAFFITIRALLKQKKLSEIKSDFINNMTHEFKTPLATISLAVDALKNEKVINDKDRINYFTGIIKEENKRMNKQVETILQAALLDKQEVQLNLKKLHAHDMIGVGVNNIRLQVEDIGGKLELDLGATKDFIQADEVHFTNLINNLLDNAVKYSRENLLIKLSTRSTEKSIQIRIEDNGIGMTKETLGRIFEKFYRAHTGNIHDVKGFGLGLSYVKTMVDAHHGHIKAESVLGKGTSFILDFPLTR